MLGKMESDGKEDEMVGCHHGLNGQEFEQVLEMVKGRESCLLQSIGLSRVRED